MASSLVSTFLGYLFRVLYRPFLDPFPQDLELQKTQLSSAIFLGGLVKDTSEEGILGMREQKALTQAWVGSWMLTTGTGIFSYPEI